MVLYKSVYYYYSYYYYIIIIIMPLPLHQTNHIVALAHVALSLEVRYSLHNITV